jgi:uncharacterized protein (DUF362 family)
MISKPRVYLNHLAKGYADNVVAGLDFAGFFQAVAPGAAVFLKPNLTLPEYRPGVMTSFECLQAVAEALVTRGYRVIIGEADGGGYNRFPMDAVFERMGIHQLARRLGLRVVNLSLLEPETLVVKSGSRQLAVPVPRLLLREIDAFISLPVPKMHLNSLVSMSIKNQWGCIQEPAERLRLHPFFAAVMFELNQRLPHAYAVMDGRYGLNRSGPLRGDPVELNWILVANDLVAADRVCCRLMQIDERKVRYLQHFQRRGWWSEFSDIQLNRAWEPLQRERFYLKRQWTDWPGVLCFQSPFLAWLGYRSPLAGFAHWLLYLFREPFYDHDQEKTKLQVRDAERVKQTSATTPSARD